MRTLILTIAILLAGTTLAHAQTPPVLSPGQVFAWDYDIAEFTKWAINRFERRVDNATTWTAITVTTTSGTADPTGLFKTYTSTPPALTSGAHTVDIRACNVTSCSLPLTLGFNAELVPIPIINLRIQPVKPPNE